MSEVMPVDIDLICRDKAKLLSYARIAKKHKLDEAEVKRIVSENRVLVRQYRREKIEQYKKEYESLFKSSVSVIKDILSTSHMADVFDREGNCTGQKVDKDVLKIKKDIATAVMESVGAKKIENRGGGIQFNTQINNSKKDNKEKALKLEKEKHIEILLSDCVVEKEEQNGPA